MIALRRVSTPLLLGLAVQAVPALADTDKGNVAAGTTARQAASPADTRDIVVTATRRGEASVPAESEFDENEIASHGADSIQELLIQLQPMIDPNGDEPVILVNGKPVGFDRSILAYPPEALTRLAVLKPEAAAQYGAPSGKHVVNLVLKQKFASLDLDAGASAATAGGQYGGSVSISRMAISGDTRWNAQAQVSRDSSLLMSARQVPPPAGVFDGAGFVTGLGGGEIDPALSRAAGSTVTVAAIPPTGDEPPSIADFAATANRRHPLVPNRFETLLPSRRAMSFAIGVTRPLGAFSVSLSLNVNRNDSHGLNGLPMASLLLPAGSPWSPFGQDVMLYRPFAGTRALRQDSSTQMLGGSLTVNGIVDGWQTSFAVNVAHNESRSVFETGIDTARLQDMIDAGDTVLDPYGPLDQRYLLATRNRYRSDTLGARIGLQKGIVRLPAGSIALSVSADASRIHSVTTQSGGLDGSTTSDRSTLSQLNGQVALSLPVSARGSGFAALGDLSIDLTAAELAMTGSGVQGRRSGAITWTPIPPIQLRASIDRADAAPSFYELDGPTITTIRRMYDYVGQEMAAPAWITGGNPALRRGTRQTFMLTTMIRPLGNEKLTVNVGYRRAVGTGIPSGFPELTPAIEAAFPERVTRDGEGHLVSVDARPINIARDTENGLNSNMALRLRRAGQGAAAGDPIQFTLSITHNWRLRSDMLIREGLPVIERLGGGGASRHMVGMQLGFGKRAFGANLGASWNSTAHVTGAGPDSTFRLSSPVMFNLSAFVALDRLLERWKDKAAVKGVKISLDIQNLLNGYRHVTLADGSVPADYAHDEVDPLGRTVRLQVRKRF